MLKLILPAILLLAVGPLYACRCRMPPPPKEALTASDAVFVGKVTMSSSDDRHNMVTVEIQKSWKGQKAKTATISTLKSSASCGFTFADGGEYLLYVMKDETTDWNVNTCSRSKPMAGAADEVKELGKPEWEKGK